VGEQLAREKGAGDEAYLSCDESAARMRGTLKRAVGTLGVLFWASVVYAQAPAAPLVTPRTSSLSWIRLPGAEECVATQALARAVEERLGRTVFVSAAQADVSVEGRIEPKAKGWHAVITLRDAGGALLGTRDLAREDKSCDAMREPLALVIAVMIDPDVALGPRPAPPSPPPPPAESPPPPAPAPTVIVEHERVYVRAPPKPSSAPWRFEASAAAITGLGLVPGAPVGGYIGWILEPPHFIGLEGYAALWPFGSKSTDAGKSAAFQLAYVGGALCPLKLHTDAVHLYGCIGMQLGVWRHDGADLAVPRSAAFRPVVNEAAEGRLSVKLAGPFVLRTGISLVVPIVRDHFVYTRSDSTSGELFRMSLFAMTLDVGVGVIFP
jgi:hypothetical protein